MALPAEFVVGAVVATPEPPPPHPAKKREARQRTDKTLMTLMPGLPPVIRRVSAEAEAASISFVGASDVTCVIMAVEAVSNEVRQALTQPLAIGWSYPTWRDPARDQSTALPSSSSPPATFWRAAVSTWIVCQTFAYDAFATTPSLVTMYASLAVSRNARS